jgi:hypothetical protein
VVTDNESARRSGWLWLWLTLFVIAILVIILWAWPAREPPARSHDSVTPTRVEAARSVTPLVPPARSADVLDLEREAPVVQLLGVLHIV